MGFSIFVEPSAIFCRNGVSVRCGRRPRHGRRAVVVSSGSAFQTTVQRDAGPDRPLVIFFAGMDARVLPENQVSMAPSGLSIASVQHGTKDRSPWKSLRAAATNSLRRLRQQLLPSEVLVIAESLGVLLALNAICNKPSLADRLVLINSATAFSDRLLLRLGSPLLPILNIDRSGKVLYPIGAIILWRFLARPDKVAQENVTPGLFSLPSVNTSSAPLRTASHRLLLLQNQPISYNDIARSISVPTLLVASARDRIFNSVKEGERLRQIIPESQLHILPESGHACLLENNVNIFQVLADYSFLDV